LEAYKEFILKHSDKCLCGFVYIKEAHFIEKDSQGTIVDGWPRGYEHQYPQHKSQEERKKMAETMASEFGIERSMIFLDIFPENKFDVSFGAWPDRMIVLEKGRFVFRGLVNYDGSKNQKKTKLRALVPCNIN
jgi:Iodothyronine deiodinase